jgi:hypothetical protein
METITNTISYEIVRETSKYNKYIKWFYRTYREDGSVLSVTGYRTQKEALLAHDNAVFSGKVGFPVGNHISYTVYRAVSL